MCHGLNDEVVLFQWAKRSFDALANNGVVSQFKSYPNLGHSACEEELEDVLAFIRQRLTETE